MRTMITFMSLCLATAANAQMIHDYVLIEGNSASELQLDAGGTGYYSTANGDSKLKWNPAAKPADKFIELKLDTPVKWTTYPVVQFNGASVQVKADYTMDTISVKVDGAKVTLKSTTTRSFPSNPEIEADTSVAKVETDEGDMNIVQRSATLNVFKISEGDKYAFTISDSKVVVEFTKNGFDILDGPQSILDEAKVGTYAISTDSKTLTMKIGANLISEYRLLSTNGLAHRFFSKSKYNNTVSVVAGDTYKVDAKQTNVKDFTGEYKWDQNDEVTYFFNADGTGGFKSKEGNIFWIWSVVNGSAEVLRYVKADGTGFTTSAEILECHTKQNGCVNYGKRIYKVLNLDAKKHFLLRKIYRLDGNGKMVEAIVDGQIFEKI